jgi:hypothetical protein
MDAMCISYSDLELAKELLLGLFADSVTPQIPCSREDGSMNMICSDGSECGTAPSWCFPFIIIRSIYQRDGDVNWLKNIYIPLKSYLEWWARERTDKDGWFHCKCSWESGEDCSARFNSTNCGAIAEHIRMLDVQAAMAHAYQTMNL